MPETLRSRQKTPMISMGIFFAGAIDLQTLSAAALA
jgi:hypothetical protein